MAATGTPTPNIGLRIPLGTDPASVDDINYNSTLIDTKLGAVGNDSVQDQLDDLNSKINAHTFTLVTTNYGIDVFYKNQAGVRILWFVGDADGNIGGSGHTFDLPSTVDSPEGYLKGIGFSGSQAYALTIYGRSVKIVAVDGSTMSGNPYINTTIVY